MSKVLEDFAYKFRYCWVCGYSLVNSWRRLEIHHIARGCHRKSGHSEECNLIRACADCHRDKLDSMPIARQLALVKMNNEEHYNRVVVNKLRKRSENAVTEEEVDAEVKCLEQENDR